MVTKAIKKNTKAAPTPAKIKIPKVSSKSAKEEGSSILRIRVRAYDSKILDS